MGLKMCLNWETTLVASVQEKNQTLLFAKLTSLVHIACKLVRNHDILHPTTRQMSTFSEAQNFSCRLDELLFSE